MSVDDVNTICLQVAQIILEQRERLLAVRFVAFGHQECFFAAGFQHVAQRSLCDTVAGKFRSRIEIVDTGIKTLPEKIQ